MQFLLLLRRRTADFPPEAFTGPLAGQEAQRVRALYTQGSIRQAWSRGDEPGACLLVEATDEAAARQIVETLPFMQAGMLDLQSVVSLLPYRGFAPIPG